jgi:D-alanyl-D-alanine carboxypeptidase
MKKVICLLLAAALVCVFAGCSSDNEPDETIDDETVSAETVVPVPLDPYLYEKSGITYLVIEKAVTTTENGEDKVVIESYEMILVNKEYHLPEDYGDGITPEAQAAYDAMAADAADAGYPIWMVSGYRSYELQKSIFEGNAAAYGEEHANTFSARPGQSEHQTGLAFDILGSETSTLTEDFGDTPTFAWMQENAADYGFIIRYLNEKTWATGYIYEPWHFRYVGVDLAHIFAESGLSVEEYAGLV